MIYNGHVRCCITPYFQCYTTKYEICSVHLSSTPGTFFFLSNLVKLAWLGVKRRRAAQNCIVAAWGRRWGAVRWRWGGVKARSSRGAAWSCMGAAWGRRENAPLRAHLRHRLEDVCIDALGFVNALVFLLVGDCTFCQYFHAEPVYLELVFTLVDELHFGTCPDTCSCPCGNNCLCPCQAAILACNPGAEEEVSRRRRQSKCTCLDTDMVECARS